VFLTAHYDRILAMDNGVVAEFDDPLTLYDRPTSVFRSLCDEANLTRAEIVRIRANGGKVETPRAETPVDAPA
jgi:ATP-binding cassette, subfamily C (CFTR/MRP), member 1